MAFCDGESSMVVTDGTKVFLPSFSRIRVEPPAASLGISWQYSHTRMPAVRSASAPLSYLDVRLTSAFSGQRKYLRDKHPIAIKCFSEASFMQGFKRYK